MRKKFELFVEHNKEVYSSCVRNDKAKAYLLLLYGAKQPQAIPLTVPYQEVERAASLLALLTKIHKQWRSRKGR